MPQVSDGSQTHLKCLRISRLYFSCSLTTKVDHRRPLTITELVYFQFLTWGKKLLNNELGYGGVKGNQEPNFCLI